MSEEYGRRRFLTSLGQTATGGVLWMESTGPPATDERDRSEGGGASEPGEASRGQSAGTGQDRRVLGSGLLHAGGASAQLRSERPSLEVGAVLALGVSMVWWRRSGGEDEEDDDTPDV
jgi:hypothetical protein